MNDDYNKDRPDEEHEEHVEHVETKYSKPIVSENKKKKSFKGSFFSYIALALVASIIGGLISPYIGNQLYGNILPEPYSNKYISDAQQINITPKDDITTVSAVAKKAMGSVVGITTIEEVQQFWFEPIEREGVGSGVIIDSAGYILTNSHVVADGKAKSVNVLFENGEKVDAEVIWNERLLDLAVVKVNKTGLPVCDLGDSDKLEIGEIAVAIGNPLGLEFQRTVTDGIVSGLNRNIRISDNQVIEDLIQTSASINPGNSGGPLLNNKGEVIGINTAKIKGGEGLGFAIPINKAKAIVKEVVENGTYETVILGITSVPVKDYEAAFGVDLNVDNGIIIIKIHEDTPASKAGLLNGDIVSKLGNLKIQDITDLKKALYKYRKGDKEELTIIRNGEKKKVNIEFTDLG